jgi:hypothetical protein
MTPLACSLGDRRRATPFTSTALKLSDRAVEGMPVRARMVPGRLISLGTDQAPPRYSMLQLRRPRRSPKPDRRRALELLAASRDGVSEAIMIAHGFTVAQMVELVRSGLASATPERVVAGKRAMQITRVRITEAGRRALAAPS